MKNDEEIMNSAELRYACGLEAEATIFDARLSAFREAIRLAREDQQSMAEAACQMVVDSFESMGADIGVGTLNHPGLAGAQACLEAIRERGKP